MGTRHEAYARVARWGLSILAAAALLPAGASAADSCVRPGTLGVSFMIDDSGSMATQDPDVLRGEAVRVGLEQLPTGSVATAGSFDTSSRELFGPSTVDDSNRTTLADEVESRLYAGGNTDYEKAFSLAIDQLDAMTAADGKALVFLSDGQPTTRYSSDQTIIDAGIPIFTIGFGDADEGILEDLAARSGGQAFWAGNTGELQSAFARVIALLTCDATSVSDSFALEPGETIRVPFAVGGDDGEFRALAAWSYGDVTVTATRPDASTLAESALQAGEAMNARDTYALISGRNPIPGGWTLNLTAAPGNDSDVSVSIDVWKRALVGQTPPAPVPPMPAPPAPIPATVATPPPPAPDGVITGRLTNGKKITVSGANLFQLFVDGYNDSDPCAGRPEDLTSRWTAVGDSFLCVFSGKVFWDNDAKGKKQAMCIVNIGSYVLPQLKLAKLGKYAKKAKSLRTALKDANKALKSAGFSGRDVKRLGDLGTKDLVKDLANGQYLAALNVFLDSRTISLVLAHRAGITRGSKAFKRLQTVQVVSSSILTVVDLAEDLINCREAFS